jgi:hypothetical protein
LFIARPLIEALAVQPFSGWVLGRFDRACNLVDEQGRMIALTLPEVGNGPFTIGVAEPGLFQSSRVDQPVYADEGCLVWGDWWVDLSVAIPWEPRLACYGQQLEISPVLAGMLRPYAEWTLLHGSAPIAEKTTRLAGEAAVNLNLALRQYQKDERFENWRKIEAAVQQLAGLGGGLTPAGDDYLIGVMAALWLSGYKNWPAQIAATAAPRTTTLSAAFLQAAGRGEFIEPWHDLVQALVGGRPETFGHALRRVAQFGASSGVDALAGFAVTHHTFGRLS